MGSLKTLSYLVVVVAIALYGVGFYLARYSSLSGTIPAIASDRKFGFADLPNLKGKVAVVTGANTGLGFGSAKALAGAGAHTVLACRSTKKCEAAAKRIRKVYPQADLATLALDLNSLASVRTFAEQLAATEPAVDVLLLNAGVMGPPHTLTADGLEMQFGVNHVAHAYLALKTLPLVREAVALRGSATITVVSSLAHKGSVKGDVYLDEAALNDPANYNAIDYYGQSKLSNILFSNELSRRLGDGAQNIFVNAIHPGAVATELGRHFREALGQYLPVAVLDFLENVLVPSISWDAETGALTQLYAAVSPDIVAQRITGRYFVPIGKDIPPAKPALDRQLQSNLWTFTAELLSKRGFTDYESV
jgi:retinol dehydrogenase-12